MTLTQLRYVYETAKVGSISLAAQKCFVSQSVLSTAISKLEAEIGNRIFSRSARGVTLTPYGKTFFDYLIPMIEHAETLEKFITPQKKASYKSVKVGSSGWPFLSTALCQVFNLYKDQGIRIECYEGLEQEIVQYVSEQSTDLAFVRRYTCYHTQNQKLYRALNLQFFPLMICDIGVTVTSYNPLFYNDSNYITPDMLANSTPIIYHYTDDVLFDDLFHRLHIPPPTNRFIANARSTVLELLSHSNSYFINTLYFNDPQNLRTRDVELPQRTLLFSNCDIKSEFGWCKRKDFQLNDIHQDIINFVADFCNRGIL